MCIRDRLQEPGTNVGLLKLAKVCKLAIICDGKFSSKSPVCTWVFLYIKYSKFWSISLGHYVERKTLISEEWIQATSWRISESFLWESMAAVPAPAASLTIYSCHLPGARLDYTHTSWLLMTYGYKLGGGSLLYFLRGLHRVLSARWHTLTCQRGPQYDIQVSPVSLF